MKQKLIIGFSVLLLLGVFYLISRDLFVNNQASEKNPCEYNLDKLKAIDTSVIRYKETRHFKPSLASPRGIAIDEKATVYIAGANEVQVYNPEWKKLAGFKIDSPANCIAVGIKREIYLGTGNHVEKYSITGVLLSRWKEINKKGFITSIAVNSSQVFVADAGNHIILRYSPDGVLLNTIGKKDTARGIDGLIVPSLYLDVAMGPYDDLWVANPGRHELENFSANGDFRSSWGISSMRLEGFAGCCNPVHFAILPDGYFVTYEKGLDRIKLYNQAGIFDCVVAGPGSFTGSSDYHCTFKTLVNDLAADPLGNILALDATSDEIRVFTKK